tara:strand:- start:7838 stop:9256 length:1419 start_codon:yes stop_codon:yes gene_type:complete
MANFSKQDRIEISLEIINTENKIKAADAGIASAAQTVIDLTAKDNPNKVILDERTENINPYQSELLLLDGITRSELVESVMIDSAKRLLGNSFFPNNINAPLPSLPDGVWKALIPFSRTHAIGKTNLEVYPATGARIEQDIIDDIEAEILLIEAEPEPNRATGLECTAGGGCAGEDNPPQLTEAACLLDNGVWTSGSDSYITDVSVATSLTTLKTLVQEWEDRMNAEKALIPVAIEANSTRIAGNTNAISDIDNAIAIIDTWQATQDYDTTTVLPTGTDGSGCILYDALEESDFEQAKIQPTTLALLKDELTARTAYAASRAVELAGDDYLGTITQDLGSGDLTAFTGLYGERMLFIDMRLNGLGGSLSKKIGAEATGGFQEDFKGNALRAEAALSIVMTAVKAMAPGIDTKYLNIKDVSGFSVGDRIYVVANEQEELSGSIDEIDGNRVKLTFKIPKKYTISNKTRIYKVL